MDIRNNIHYIIMAWFIYGLKFWRNSITRDATLIKTITGCTHKACRNFKLCRKQSIYLGSWGCCCLRLVNQLKNITAKLHMTILQSLYNMQDWNWLKTGSSFNKLYSWKVCGCAMCNNSINGLVHTERKTYTSVLLNLRRTKLNA